MTKHPWPLTNDWTTGEIDALKRAAIAGLSTAAIASHCGRSEVETEEKLGALIDQGFLIIVGKRVTLP